MVQNSVMVPQTEQRFAETVTRILKEQGYCSENDTKVSGDYGFLMKKNAHIYCVMIKYSSSRVFSTGNAVAIYNRLEMLWQTNQDWIPLVVVGGEVSYSLRAEFLAVNPRTDVMDIQNLLYLAAKDRELYDDLVAYLPYSISGLTPRSPGVSGVQGAGSTGSDLFSRIGITDGDDRYKVTANHGTGKPYTLSQLVEMQNDPYAEELCRKLEQWKGGKGAKRSIEYEKLCVKVLIHLFRADLMLWEEQAKSNSELYRFDLICKIKQGNQKDFWEMAERYFRSKYIIFEFKNYSGKVTQMEVTTTARYLYTKALRSVAIIISPKGFSEHADKAARGALREEGKLILSLSNVDLINMLRLQDRVNGPADYLSTKLDTLLINLEK